MLSSEILKVIPQIRSPRWTPALKNPIDPASILFQSKDGLRVVVSCDDELDGKFWLHVSVSRADRLPSWGDLTEVKDAFIGRDKLAVQVLPRKADYVNCHEFCLHLFHCLDGDPCPDFRRDGLI